MFSLDCHINSFAWFFLASGAINMAVAVIIAPYRRRSQSIAWFQTFSILEAAISIVQAWLGCTTNQTTFWALTNLSQLLLVFLPIVELVFVLYFTNRERWLNKVWVIVTLILYSSLSLILDLGSDLVVSHQLSSAVVQQWGLRAPADGALTNIIAVLFSVGFLLPIVLTALYYHHLHHSAKRHEVRLVLLALSLPTLFSILVEGLLGSIIHVPPFPGSLLLAATNVTVAYAIIRYGLYIFNLNSATANLPQTMPGGLIILDHIGNIQYINQGTSSLLGYSEPDLVGNSFEKLLKTPELNAKFQHEVVEQLARQSKVSISDTILYRASSEPLPVNLSATSIRDHDNLINIVLVFSDISPLKEAEARLIEEKASVERKVKERTHELSEERGRLTSSIASLPLGLMMIDTNKQLVVRNGYLSKIMGYRDENWGLLDFTHDLKNDIDVLAVSSKVQATKQPIQPTEFSYGTKILSMGFYPAFADESVIGTIVLTADITEAKVLERSKDEFFSIASHELRTPLTAIKGNASMMLDYYKDAMKDEGLKEMAQDIHTSSIRLIEIVNDFLDLSRLEQGKIKYKLQPVALDKIIEQVAYELGPVLKQKHTSLKIGESIGQLGAMPLVQVDPDRIKQVLYNLVGNAAKFTEEGTITITAHRQSGFMKVTVTDTGLGITLEGRKLLFRKFQQAGSSLLTRDTTRGTGLGLYISKLIIEGMHGQIGLENSTPGEGSAFFFTVPLAVEGDKPKTDAVPTDESRPSGSNTQALARNTSTTTGGQCILIFEDDPYVQRMYQRLFALEDWQIELVSDGSHGIDRIAASKYDLILLDLMMPNVDGMTLLKLMKKNPKTRDVPVIVLTNIGEADMVAEATQLGVVDYLVKAELTPEQLLSEVKKHLMPPYNSRKE